MRKVAIFVGFVGMCVAISRFLLARLFLTERLDGAIGLFLATGLFTIAIAAVVRNELMGRAGQFFYGAERTS